MPWPGTNILMNNSLQNHFHLAFPEHSVLYSTLVSPSGFWTFKETMKHFIMLCTISFLTFHFHHLEISSGVRQCHSYYQIELTLTSPTTNYLLMILSQMSCCPNAMLCFIQNCSSISLSRAISLLMGITLLLGRDTSLLIWNPRGRITFFLHPLLILIFSFYLYSYSVAEDMKQWSLWSANNLFVWLLCRNTAMICWPFPCRKYIVKMENIVCLLGFSQFPVTRRGEENDR